METRRWTNPSQPQTLQIAVYLLYFDAVLGVLFGRLLNPLGLLLIAGAAGGGFGIANEKRWGYALGVAVSALGLLPFVVLVFDGGLGDLLNVGVLLSLVFPVAQFALLLHPLSREYQRIWFT
jgi:hypothetical protein